ncbi:hypothetical protein LTR04_002935 [Oleoguttula sp. CCFEE 6159]|nr:hypothetical protein LTR04_002935 [Oleoguttula sp. CCFEE 6159]
MIANKSVKRFKSDDYVMLVTFCFYTGLIVLIDISAHHATNLFPPDELDAIMADPEEVKSRILGSKIVIGLEIAMMASTWGVKACLLILYYRMTQNLKEQRWVIGIAVYCVLGNVTIEICYFAVWCRPFSQYWAMPVQDPQCATYVHYDYMQVVFNISSDAMMLAIPIPLIWKAQVPLRRKVVLLGVFSLGVLIIIAAILNKYNNLASPWTTTYQAWYMIEASIAIYVANIMCWWPLVRFLFGVKAFNAKTTAPDSDAAFASGQGRDQVNDRIATTRNRMNKFGSLGSESGSHDDVLGSSSSTSKDDGRDHHTSSGTDAYPLEIWQKMEYDVERGSVDPGTKLDMRTYDHHHNGGSKYGAMVRAEPVDDEITPS